MTKKVVSFRQSQIIIQWKRRKYISLTYSRIDGCHQNLKSFLAPGVRGGWRQDWEAYVVARSLSWEGPLQWCIELLYEGWWHSLCPHHWHDNGHPYVTWSSLGHCTNTQFLKYYSGTAEQSNSKLPFPEGYFLRKKTQRNEDSIRERISMGPRF